MTKKSNLTEILTIGEATEAMVNDFNLANQDIKSFEFEDLTFINDNIVKLIASLEDLQRTVKEEMKAIEEEKVETKVSNILKGYVNASKDNKDVLTNNNFTSNINEKKVKDILETLELKNEETKKEAKTEIEIPKEIIKAVEIAKKYKIGVPYIEDGVIIDFIKNGKTDINEEKKSIAVLFMSLLDSECITDKVDREYMMNFINSELRFDDFIKSLIHRAPAIRVINKDEAEKIHSMLSKEDVQYNREKIGKIFQMI